MFTACPHSCCNCVHWGSILRLWSRTYAETVKTSFRGPSFLLGLLFSIDIRVWSTGLLLCVTVLLRYIKCEKSGFLRKELLAFSAHANSRFRLDKLALMVKLVHPFLVVERRVPRLWVSDYICSLGGRARVPRSRSAGLCNLRGVRHLARPRIVHVVTNFRIGRSHVQLINLCWQRLLSRSCLAFSTTVVLVMALSCDNAFQVDIYTWTFLLLDGIIIIIAICT